MDCPINREYASDLMQRRNLAAIVLCEPEAFRYATGAWPGPASLFRRAGAAFAVVPQRADQPVCAVVTDFDADRVRAIAPDLMVRTHQAWIDTVSLVGSESGGLEERIEQALAATGRTPDFARPATFECENSVAQLAGLLAELGVSTGRLGFDLDFVPAADLEIILSLLPDFEIVNGSPVLSRLLAIKSAGEIDLLRRGIAFSEQGFARLQSEAKTGMRQADLIGLYRAGVNEASAGFGYQVSTAEYMSLGARPGDRPAEPGDPLKADMICVVDGYQADMSRNFVFGPPSDDQKRLHTIAEQVFETGLAVLVPGNTLADVHRAVSAGLAQAGLPSYRRGHFGHGVGLSVFSEQWPFIAADSDVEIVADMVLAFEIPLYVEGVASFNLEEQLLITEDGAETMNRLPRTLGIIS